MNIFLLQTKWIFALAACLAASPVLSDQGRIHNSTKQKVVPSVQQDSMEADILNYINQYRQSKGLAALHVSDIIAAEAKKHSMNMAASKTAFGHDGFENRVSLIMHQLGSMRRSAENVAFGQLSARAVVNGWLNSPGHRRNIEGDYTLTGIGTATAADGTIYFTQIFTAK